MAEEHETALTWIMYIGVGLSVVCLTLVLVVYTVLPSLRTKPKIILMNLSASLLVALSLFLVVASTKIKGSACTAMAGTLHYALLATFAWMLVQGHFLHQSLTNVFAQRKAKNMLRKYTLAAYLGPALFVLAAALAWPAAYDREGLCWLNGANGGIWLFAGPALLVCVINLSFLVQIIRTVYALPPAPAGKTMMHGRVFDVAAAKRSLKAAMSFSVVMGLTWLFGLLSLIEGAEIWYGNIPTTEVSQHPHASLLALCLSFTCALAPRRMRAHPQLSVRTLAPPGDLSRLFVDSCAPASGTNTSSPCSMPRSVFSSFTFTS